MTMLQIILVEPFKGTRAFRYVFNRQLFAAFLQVCSYLYSSARHIICRYSLQYAFQTFAVTCFVELSKRNMQLYRNTLDIIFIAACIKRHIVIVFEL